MVVSLQNISSYSLLESPMTVQSLLQGAKQKGYSSIALTDLNVTYGLVNFYKLAKQEGIKPLLGMQITLTGLISSGENYNLILIAKSNKGYQNLLSLSSKIQLNKTLAAEEVIKEFKELFVIVPANADSELVQLADRSDNQGESYLRKLTSLLDSSNELYLGIHADKEESNYINYLKTMSKQFKLPLVAVEDVQYQNPQDKFLQVALQNIKVGEVIKSNLKSLLNERGEKYLKDEQKLEIGYRNFDLQEALKNAEKIAQQANAEIEFQEPQLPTYPQDKFSTSQEYLVNLVQEGLAKKFNNHIPRNYQQRLEYELKIIHEMGFNDYFLIVWDAINYAHSKNILTGPGRGSAAGSLVSYALNITSVDPIKYNLLFERFLNPARKQMPDIDLDIPDKQRSTIIKYMAEKYGREHTAQILTFVTFSAKQVLGEVAKVFGFNESEIAKWTKAVPSGQGKMTLEKAYQQSKRLQFLVNASPMNNLLFATAKHLEGLPLRTSIHAAGLVLSDKRLDEVVGLQPGILDIPITQQTKENVEKLGLLKIDFLGLKTLTILENILALVQQEGTKIELERIPLNDVKTFRTFQKGETDSIFQFESAGIKRVLRKLKPTSFEELVAINALYRPGPMQNIDSFIRRKNRHEKVTYPDQSLENILRPTYGIWVYQEQVMKTAQAFAGYSLGEADLLRRAISKKDKEIIAHEKDKFIQRALKNGHPENLAEKIYENIAQFAGYGFNRSHAVAYSKLAYWLAYLKTNYPKEFYTVLLNDNFAHTEKVKKYLQVLRDKGVRILPPSINKSAATFTVEKDGIRVGLKEIKNLNQDFIKEIENLTSIYSLEDFLQRIDKKYLRQDQVELLVKAGAFDEFKIDRLQVLSRLSSIISTVKFKEENSYADAKYNAVVKQNKDRSSQYKRAELEEEVMGFSVTASMLMTLQQFTKKKYNTKKLGEFTSRQQGIAIGELVSLKKVRTKNDEEMAFTTFKDTSGEFEIIIFPRSYSELKDKLDEGKIYLLRVSTQNDRYDPNKIQFLLQDARKIKVHEKINVKE
ncbi:DNA polymerase III subunit alpha [Lactobacillus sp. PV037]|uniref:DNA polymerase III subunit alpha n=1 Tax=unclassified Lactobacillus TaxID=2620435 RepID=UPI0022402EFC|nr:MULTISPECIES: DNA polymerase III subunit alpha [unclassified Lactobacillus]QNQ82371.1 DNA polymerase III subunit alpha [Lactobacillus sp. PV012]QNQ83515.1 DNA polymerase III subunit alpha [Lactobacillus sp. PV037]